MILDVKNLSYYYGNRQVLKDINFTVESGKFVSIIGPNGSGKTSLMRSILSVSNGKREGNIFLKNENIENYSNLNVAKIIAAVFQNNSLQFDFTVEEIIEMGRFPYLGRFGNLKEKDKEIINKSMKQVGVDRFANRSYKELSGGELQRVLIGRALAQETEILFLDEPVNHLDLNFQISILRLLRLLNKKEKKTIIIILHDLNLASLFSDIIFLMKDGEISKIGKPKNIITERNIKDLYDTNVYINFYPNTEIPYIIPDINLDS